MGSEGTKDGVVISSADIKRESMKVSPDSESNVRSNRSRLA